jgi:hypothetical protein
MEAKINREDEVGMVEWSRKSSRKLIHRYRAYSLQDLLAFEYMSMRDRGKRGACIPVFAGQHEPEPAEAGGIVGHSLWDGDDEGGSGKSRRRGIDGGTVM